MSTEIDIPQFRHVVSHFATGVVVICGNENGQLVGFAAQSFVSLSLDPPLILFCPQRTSKSWPRISQLEGFCVNILSEKQGEISNAFAVSGDVPNIDWKPSAVSGSPILKDALAYIDCVIHEELDGGDHTIVVAAVKDLAVCDPKIDPLLFYQGRYGGFEPSDLTA